MEGNPTDGLYLHLRKDSLGDPKCCEIYLVSGDFVFPGEGWTDLSGIVEGWRNELAVLERDGVCELWFLDGPYQVNIARNDRQYEFEFYKRFDGSVSLEKVLSFSKEASIDNIVRALSDWRADIGVGWPCPVTRLC